MNTQLSPKYHPDYMSQPSIVTLAPSNLSATLLNRAIEQNLGLDCNACHDIDSLPTLNAEQLVLIDCSTLQDIELHQVLKQLNSEHKDIRIALLNLEADAEVKSLVRWPQVKGIFNCQAEQEHLFQGITALNQGSYWLPREVMQELLETTRKAPTMIPQAVELTRREQQILQSLAEGSTNQAIADCLFLSEHTVKSHLYNIFRKIGVKNRLQACNWAQQCQ